MSVPHFPQICISFLLLGGGIELGAYLLAFVVLNGFGRKYSLMVYLFLSGIFCVAAVSVQHFVPGMLRRNFFFIASHLSMSRNGFF